MTFKGVRIIYSENLMKTFKLGLCILISMVTLVSTSCIMDNPNTESKTVLIPVFNKPYIPSRALNPDENRNTEKDLYGTMFLPQLTHFTLGNSTNLSTDNFPVSIYGETFYGDIEFDPAGNQYTIEYNIGDNDGYIKVTIDRNGSFSYAQYLLVNVHDREGTMYLIHEIKNGQISIIGDRIGDYVARGQLYYGHFQEDETGTSTSIITDDVGQAKTYLRGTDAMVYGFADPYRVMDGISFDPKDLFIADKKENKITVDDILVKLDEIQSFQYERPSDWAFTMTDVYYFFEKDKYDWFYSYGNESPYIEGLPDVDTREKIHFETATGYSFEDLGYPSCENIYHFLGESLNLDYIFIGNGESENWSEAEDISYSKFTIEEPGVYMVPFRFKVYDDDKTPLFNGDLDVGAELLELQAKDYYIGYSSSEPEMMKQYSYLFKLD